MPSEELLLDGLNEAMDNAVDDLLRLFGQEATTETITAAVVLDEPTDEEVDEMATILKLLAAGAIIGMLLNMGSTETQAIAILGTLGQPAVLGVEQVRQRLAALHRYVNRKVDEEYRRLIAAGVSERKALAKATRRGAQAARVQAELEALHATNAGIDALGNSLLAAGLGVTKTWRTRRDNRVREAHVRVEGQQRPHNSAYSVSGWPMRFPGDMSAPPELWVNCRCISVLSSAIGFPSEN